MKPTTPQHNFNDLPTVSVVITTYNEEKRLPACLDSIERQKYPKEKIEIIVVDDKSQDKTVEIAKKYTSEENIYYSGKHYCEISRAIGLQKAKNELILLIDADNILPNNDFLMKNVEPFLKEENLVGSYPERFYYDENDPAANRYCTLYGINDPLQQYSGAREHLSYAEDSWVLAGNATEHDNYYFVEFEKGSLLTLGAIGFLGRRELMVKKITKYGYFFHSDAFNELIFEGHNKFAVVKQSVIHNHVDSHKHFVKKLDRNIGYFLNHGDTRETIWITKSPFKLIKAVVLMGSFFVPLYDAIKGYLKFKDWAWFLHPIYCTIIFWLYSYRFVTFKIAKMFK